MNTDAPWPTLPEAEARVLGIQTKLHRWATDDPGRRFDDLSNLVADPAFLVVAWDRVRGNRGARSAGVDGVKPDSIVFGTALCEGLRAELKARTFSPMPVRERLIPKAGGKARRLGIATARDRVVQASLKLVLEPIFEADFKPCSYGFRPRRRAQDAIAEIHMLATNSYEWVLEGDITACFDEIDHTALMDRVRHRIGDKRVLGLVKAFLHAGILTEDGVERDTVTGTPQGGILSPLLANVALSVLDEHFADRWGNQSERAKRRRHGLANYRLVRYADDFVVMVSGTRAHAEDLREEVAAVLAPMGLRLSEAKTRIAHIDEGLDFLGYRIQRQTKRGTTKRYVYTFPSKKALASIKAKVRALTRGSTDQPLAVLLHRLNPVLRGWTNYFRYGVSSATFAYLDHFTSHSYEWVLEGDIEACFDEISHPALMDRVRRRVGDKRVLALVKAFLHAGILSEDGVERDTVTGTPQGGILSPLLANVALSELDEHFAERWGNQ
ncbi:MAG: group II intron reverse transcriptase/maturase, partial [Actinomycetota bacterium]|nr:group II intron reverse transcriptase/maturase [Actinomycetota bacterium]